MSEIIDDLSRHLDQKLKRAIEDFVDLCGRTDVDEHHVLVRVITICSHYAALAALQLDASEQEYLKICHHQYRKGKECLTQATAQDRFQSS